MNNLKPIAFLVPVIALVLVLALYRILSKKASNKTAFKKFVFIVTVLAFLLNLAWELWQLPLYKGSSYDIQHIIFCALASVADVIMVLLIYFGLALIYKNPLWIEHLKWQRIIVVMVIGGDRSRFSRDPVYNEGHLGLC